MYPTAPYATLSASFHKSEMSLIHSLDECFHSCVEKPNIPIAVAWENPNKTGAPNSISSWSPVSPKSQRELVGRFARFVCDRELMASQEFMSESHATISFSWKSVEKRWKASSTLAHNSHTKKEGISQISVSKLPKANMPKEESHIWMFDPAQTEWLSAENRGHVLRKAGRQTDSADASY